MPTTHVELDRFVDLLRRGSSSGATLLTFDDTNVIERIDLDPVDPVGSMFGRSVTTDVVAVGLFAPAIVTSRSDDGPVRNDHTVIHVCHRNGSALTVLDTTTSSRRFGPTTEPQTGRVPDACRRMLGLATAPPTETMTTFVLAAWLEVVARHCLEHPTASWSDIVALHPARSRLDDPTTPAGVADATRALGTALDWERFRRVIATVGGFPFGPDAATLARWMDTGIFSRWAIDSLPSPTDLLDILESVLGPSPFDRLWATVRLCD
jgi:hypothetical protein